MARAPAPRASAVTTTCSPPSPMIGRRSAQSFEGCSSRPTRKSMTTTPNSAKCMTSSPSSRPTRPRAEGPIDHAGDEIAQHGAETQPRGEGRRDDGGGQIDEGAEEQVLRVHQMAFSWKAGGRA